MYLLLYTLWTLWFWFLDAYNVGTGSEPAGQPLFWAKMGAIRVSPAGKDGDLTWKTSEAPGVVRWSPMAACTTSGRSMLDRTYSF